MAKFYLGDAVYVEHDACGLVLTTEDGIRATNRIVLEPQVYSALVAYVEALAHEPQEPGLSSSSVTDPEQRALDNIPEFDE